MIFRDGIIILLAKETGLNTDEVGALLETPPSDELGDYAFPCFSLAGREKKSPAIIATELEKRLLHAAAPFLKKAEAKGPYLNIFISPEKAAQHTLTTIRKEGRKYGMVRKAKRKRIVIDFSSPNIAKPFGIGHLRSTMIGSSLAALFRAQGYTVIAVNHLGDWGTQFGKLITAYKRWGDKKKLKSEPIKYLLSLYVRFHKEAENDPAIDDEARAWFKRLEDGHKEATLLWKLFRSLSIEEFNRLYTILNVEFDALHGEAHYNRMLAGVIAEMKKKGITEESNGALVIPLKDEEEGMPPLILRKRDGATTYATRDIAAALHRLKEYRPEKIIYVVGSEQNLHFRQLFAALKKAGSPPEAFIHVNFGMIRFPEGRMSTRKGNIIFLEEVLDRAKELALRTIKEKNPGLNDKQQVAAAVGIGAVIFGDLVNDRTKDIAFDWSRILDFEGETAPYLQYAHARACSILRKAHTALGARIDAKALSTAEEARIVKRLAGFPDAIADAAAACKPHILAHYLIDLAQAFNEFYHKHQVLGEQGGLMKARLILVDCTRQVLRNGLAILGIKAPEEM